MVKELSIIFAGEDRNLAHVLDEIRKTKLAQIHVECVALANLREALSRLRPHLVVYDANGDADSVRQTVLFQSQTFSEIPWAVVSEGTDLDEALQFFRMGALDFLKSPVDATDVKRLIEKVVNLNSRTVNGKDEPRNSIAIFSTKGGVGLTTVAVNLAAELANRKAGKILLLDLVLQHGNVADFLDVPAQYTLIDTIENFDRLDSNLLENSLVKHGLGFYVLPCPREPEKGDFLTSKELSDVFHFFKNNFPYVIADIGHEFTKTALSFLDLADLILLVTTPDVPSLYNTRSAFDTLKKLGYNPQKIKIILNRWRMKGEITTEVIQRKLALDIFHRLVDDPLTCLNSINLGKPFLISAKKSEIAKSFANLASLTMAPSRPEKSHVTQ